jgi:hypothetical protein
MMSLPFMWFAGLFLFGTAVTAITPPSPTSPSVNLTLEHRDVALAPIDSEAVWSKAVCNGQKLYQAMTTPKDTAHRFTTPILSEWDGPLTNQLHAWGYNEPNEGSADSDCDFGSVYPSFRRAFSAMGLGTALSSKGGPKHCYRIEHYDGPTVIRDAQGNIPPKTLQRYIGPDGQQR